MAKLLLLLMIAICGAAVPIDVRPEPPVVDPVLPTEREPFFKNASDLIPHSPETPAEVEVVHQQNLDKKFLIALVVSSSLLGTILLALSCFSFYRLKKLRKCNGKSDPNLDVAKGISFGPILDKFAASRTGGKKGSIIGIEYSLLVSATNNFDEANVLGEGGLGRVYKAHFNDHFHAAVKKLIVGGPEAEREFENEVESLSKIQHHNVVSLLGYCVRGEARFLIYEMMENGSLEFHLHGPSHRSNLTWHVRMKIALDIARGLEYLHERCNPPVIHRDLKSSNILLSSDFTAKLSNFGLAITGKNSAKTNIKLSGTVGYVAPEYLLDGKLTEKSDVYAFGVILLELLTGKRPVERVAEAECQSIVTWVMPQLTDRSKLPSIVDPAIRNTIDLKHLYQVAAITVLCVQPEPCYRPLITDILHSFIPLVPVDLGGAVKVTDIGT